MTTDTAAADISRPRLRPMKRAGVPDATIPLLMDPYRWIARQCDELAADAFEARLMLVPTIFMSGREAAELFYSQEHFVRHGAAPRRLVKSLFGVGAVQSLDGREHRQRKAMFMDLMDAPSMDRLQRCARHHWTRAARAWGSESVALYPEVRRLTTRTVCDWAGVPLEDGDVYSRTEMLTQLYEGAGALGPKHWMARLARRHAEGWILSLVEATRRNEAGLVEGLPAFLVATHRDGDGRFLPAQVAAVEILNLLRPMVATSVYVVFIAHALTRYVAMSGAFAQGLHEEIIHEVRRFYPFFPAIVARVRETFDWKTLIFPRGRRVVLDLHGTNHDPSSWDEPAAFRPTRFQTRAPGRFDFVPQGGGEHATGHRCAGEAATFTLMQVALDTLGRKLECRLKSADWELDMKRLPALPRGEVHISVSRIHD